MADRFRPITVKPKQGGKLMTAVSSEECGLYNYRRKLDWRRVMDAEWRAEGYDGFRPNVSIPLGQQPYPNYPDTDEPVTLVTMARQPNGRTAIIAATPTTIYRYFSLEDGAYFEGTGANAYFEESGVDAPYFDDDPGEWLVIGTGFSTSGKRWQAVNINGYLVLNNQVDLPVTYRVEEYEVVPIYELREAGIASVGCIAEYNGILMVGDVSEIHDDKLVEIMTPTDSGAVTASQTGSFFSGLMTATLTGNDVVATGAVFNFSHIGKTIRFLDGTARVITAVTSDTEATVGGDAYTISPGLPFYLLTTVTESGSITATVAANVITASAAIFDPAHLGLRIRLGDVTRIVANVTGVTTAVADGDPLTITTPTNFSIFGEEFIVTASAAIFTTDMVGLQLIWDTGETREIVSFISDTKVVVDNDAAIASGGFSITNPDAYAPFTDQTYINRIQYRVAWSMPDEPRRWAASVPGSITAGSNVITLDYPALSFEQGQEIIINGAGINGGNLTATILFISQANMKLTIDEFAATTIADTEVQQFDAVGSIVSFDDLQDDGSGIINMLELRGVLVIHKDTSIFLGLYNGPVEGPFTFRQAYGSQKEAAPASGKTLFYKHSLINVNGEYQLYAGRNSFYRFDLTTETPSEFLPFEFCKDVFFGNVTLEQTDLIFAADNVLTKEIFLCFPSQTDDKALRYDYFQGTVATTSAGFTAAASIKRPVSGGILVGASQDWFIMGTSAGAVLRYGLVDANVVSSGNVTATQAGTTITANAAIFSAEHVGRTILFNGDILVHIAEYVSPTVVTAGLAQNVTARTFRILPAIWNRAGEEYDSVLECGLEGFGNEFNEKTLDSFVPLLASGSDRYPSPDGALEVEVLGARNTAEGAAVLGSTTLASPKTENLVPVFFVQNYFGDRLTVSGRNNPCQLVGRIYNIDGVNSRSFIRREA